MLQKIWWLWPKTKSPLEREEKIIKRKMREKPRVYTRIADLQWTAVDSVRDRDRKIGQNLASQLWNRRNLGDIFIENLPYLMKSHQIWRDLAKCGGDFKDLAEISPDLKTFAGKCSITLVRSSFFRFGEKTRQPTCCLQVLEAKTRRRPSLALGWPVLWPDRMVIAGGSSTIFPWTALA